jgi:hypothetical protein
VNEDSHVLRRVRKIEPVAVSVFVFLIIILRSTKSFLTVL